MKYIILLSSIFLFVACCNKGQNTTEKTDIKSTTAEKVEDKKVAETSKTDVKEEVKETTKEGKQIEYKWETPSCSISGTYDSSKYTEEELKATAELCYTFDGAVLLMADAHPLNITDIAKLNTTDLDKEYKEQQKMFSRPVVKTEFMEKLRKDKIKELDEEYELKKITIEAYNNPKVLLKSKYASKCNEYVEALTAEDTTKLFDAWTKIVDEQAKTNGAPELLKAEHKTQKESADKLAYAKKYVMTYGWWNCANGNMFRVEADGKSGEAFEKLFTNVKRECDEP